MDNERGKELITKSEVENMLRGYREKTPLDIKLIWDITGILSGLLIAGLGIKDKNTEIAALGAWISILSLRNLLLN